MQKTLKIVLLPTWNNLERSIYIHKTRWYLYSGMRSSLKLSAFPRKHCIYWSDQISQIFKHIFLSSIIIFSSAQLNISLPDLQWCMEWKTTYTSLFNHIRNTAIFWILLILIELLTNFNLNRTFRIILV